MNDAAEQRNGADTATRSRSDGETEGTTELHPSALTSSSSDTIPPKGPQHGELQRANQPGILSSSSNSRKSSSSDCVQVAVRIRPLLPLERQEPCMTILDEPIANAMANDHLEDVATSVRIGGKRSGVTYTFDCVYGTTTTQAQVYHFSVVPLLNACLEGYNATILAYGQTGSGKTHTILGNHVTGDVQGVLPRTIHALFDALSGAAEANNNVDKENNTSDHPCDSWKVQVQFLEIYGEEIRDLLKHGPGEDGGGVSNVNTGNFKVAIRDGGPTDEPEVLGANQPQVHSAAEALQMLQTGRLRRVTAATAMNATSSRSHALFTIMVEQEWKGADSTATGTIRRSKFHFVDLAGSERQKRTQAVGQRLKEGIEINKGLLVLGNVIAALASSSKTNKPFVPYRDSKLTRLLRGSLGGNHKTLMIACVSPSGDNLEESLNCLRYANRAKQIENKAIINLDPTSQYIQTLQQHIALLAELALFHAELSTTAPDQETRDRASSKEGSVYTKDQLKALAGGETVETVVARKQVLPPKTPTTNQVASAQSVNAKLPSTPSRDAKKSTLDATISPRVSVPTDPAEESLYWQKAQSSMHQVLSRTGSSVSRNDEKIADDINSNPKVQELTMQKMIEYERKIGELKKALAVEQSQRAMLQEEQSWVDEVQKSLQKDRGKLERLQGTVERTESKDEDESALEAEEFAEQVAVERWTKKYTKRDSSGADDAEDREDDDTITSSPPQSPSHFMVRAPAHKVIQEDLLELARSIAAKEELIGQLKTSQERYEHMREFYEEKLKQMEQSLVEKEEERETLVKRLEEAQTNPGGPRTQELKEKLRKKEEHIAELKKKSRELRSLTTISSRNANEIARLSRDVEDMKRRKVDLQRTLTSERKSHAEQIKRLQKEALQKERELNKYKRLTTKKEVEAEKANKVAKSRLEELGALRQKYKDTEKKLRLQSVKRGVRAKAGIDPVLVGQRDKAQQTVDTNALRDLFDEKVSKVARKEALVNKLAEEWEEHFQLSSKRDEVAVHESAEDLENVELQLKYKEDRIRTLAKRLEKENSGEDSKEKKVANESFLFDAQFERVCKAAPPDVAHKSLAKVLFGMVVRERRRVAALARTACSLDERLQSTTEDLEAKEEALRSYVDEQRVEVAEMSQMQQNQILSLMELVKADSSGFSGALSASASVGSPQRTSSFDETLLVLANERISVLEKQLESKEDEAGKARSHRRDLDETKESLRKSKQDNEGLTSELARVNYEMLQLKEMLASTDPRDADFLALTAAHQKLSAAPRGSPRVKPLPAAIRDIDFSDSDQEEGTSSDGPEWANEIMEDLALIAEGKIPPSLKGTAGFGDLPSASAAAATTWQEDEERAETSVFARLTDPQNFTGTQKNRSKAKGRAHSQNWSSTDFRGGEGDQRPPERSSSKAKSRSRVGSTSRISRSESSGKSVFDRLANPDSTRSHAAKVTKRKESFSSNQPRSSSGKEENVFERLSNNTTVAFSIRQTGPPDEEEQQPMRITAVDSMLDEVLGSSTYSNNTSSNVFERLTKTTTEAYAMKVNRNGRD
mmetsp:Transcript_3665/g.10080  ORF Transcript_3665/g.10080 Transcript_3665/m.10080 type:complete len:1557 (-) Transcript_3665:124-4794(-)